MNRTDFQQLSRIRVAEATVLLDNGHFLGAYYLLGYAVECALKACIAKQVRRYDFPERQLVLDSYTHNLITLLKISGSQAQFDSDVKMDADLERNWFIVKDWSEHTRYATAVLEDTAKDFYQAAPARRGGILPWLRKRW